ncbi:MAG TPA: PQQ-binding-like beta-propeller repeat protein [Candidatus Binatia bacterium]|nr:PQQ-binding-like beta-propeller repeat protein [Candidatus Binatia bacterium]
MHNLWTARRAPWVSLAAALLGAGCGSSPPALQVSSASLGTPPPSVSSTPAPPTATPSAAPAAWLTYHGDLARSGDDPSSPPVSAPALGWRSPTLDGPIWAEPLVDGGRVLVATEGGSIYALDAVTGAVIWRAHVDDPISRSQLPCGDISPLGITGTPVIDPATQTLYAAAERSDGSHELVALSVASGAVLWRRVIDAPGTVPRDQQQRAALAVAGGRVLVGLGGLDGDCGTYHGYVASVGESGVGPVDYYVVPVINGAGIWAPSGPAVSASGEVYVADGNSEEAAAATVSFDHSDSVIALTPEMAEQGYFAPTDWRHLSEADLDLGSTGPVLDGDGILIAGKDGILYLLGAAALGGIGGQLASLGLGSGAFGGLALDGQTVLVPTTGQLDAVSVDVPGRSLKLIWSRAPTWPPIVAGGEIWAVTQGGADLVALSPADGSQRFSLPLGSVEHFTTPAAAAGWVYVGSGGDQVVAVKGV